MPSLRLDRAWSVGLVRPLLRRLPAANTVPILMYHSIQRRFSHQYPYYELNTSPEIFESHMKYLWQQGYKTVDLEDARRKVAAGEGIGHVVLTFDDGYRDFYTEAFPILAKYGFQATVFVVTDFVRCGKTASHDDSLTWNDLRELLRYRMGVGSHTVTHPQLHLLQGEQLTSEIVGSKETIECTLGVPIRSFAYPFAFPEHHHRFLSALRNLLQQSGYTDGVCTTIGTYQSSCDPFFMPRLPVNSHDDLRLFDAKLNGGYDWLHTIQRSRKFFHMRHLVKQQGNPLREKQYDHDN